MKTKKPKSSDTAVTSVLSSGMTTPSATIASVVMLSSLLEKFLLVQRRKPIDRDRKALLCSCLREWGDVAIFSEPQLRELVADSVALRLGLSPPFVRGRINLMYKIHLWIEENR